MKKTIRLLLILTGVFVVNVSCLYCKTLTIDYFDDESFVNSLGGKNDVWISNPHDRTIACNATLKPEKRGYSLRLSYDIDSAITYLSNSTYILDYSDYSIIGLAQEIPHTASGGFYFLIENTDLTRYKYLIFYAKGDEECGYTRRFKIELKTKDQTSSYIIEGMTDKWKRFVIPLSIFDRIANWKKITELTIVLDEVATDKKGVLYFDDFYFAIWRYETPRLVFRDNKIKFSKNIENYLDEIFLRGNISMNYRYTPERKTEVFHAEGINLEGQSGRVMGRIEVEFASREYGESFLRRYTDDYPYTKYYIIIEDITLPTIQVKVERLNPLLNKITLGNIWIGYSPYIISPYWGWKGISIKGRKGGFEHDTFMIKRQYNSFSLGNRSLLYAGDHRLRLIGLYDYKTAKLTVESDKWDIRPVSSEYSYLATTLFRFLNYRINCELSYGHYNYKKDAEADYSSPRWPEYSHRVSSSSVNDRMYEAKLFFDGIVPGNKLCISYRDIGQNFTPEYRQEPVVFEDVTGDKEGYCIRFKQWYNVYNLNLYWDDFTRKSDKDYYGNIFNYGGGFVGAKGMELSVNREIKREKYKNTALGIEDRDEKVESIIVVFEYSLIYPLTPGVRYPLTPKITLREDKIHHKSTDSKYTAHSLQVDLNYKVETDFGFSVSYKTTRYGDPSWESREAPYDDDYLNAYFNIRF